MKKSSHRRQNNSSYRQIGIFLFYLAFGFYVIMFCIGRFVLTHKVVAAQLVTQAVFIDLATAVFIMLLSKLLHKIHITVSAAILILLTIFHIANMEMAAALNTVINITDMWNATDTHFLRGSLSNLTFPRYTFFTLLSTILYLVALAKVNKNRLIKIKYLLLYIFISISTIYILSPVSGEWHSSNSLWLSITGSIPSSSSATTPISLSKTSTDIPGQPQPSEKNDVEIYFQKPPDLERNVLFVVLEGIPGVYVRQVQEWTGVKYPVEMPNLSRIAEKSVIVPNFVTHNRQTIRGLYSLLSGDYSKLSLTTPKVYEYIRLTSESRNPCLPEILANAGYTTVYLQAADLAYMSKDKFMPEAGFELVFGKEYFQYQWVPFGWGPDDKAFFEQAADFIEKLNKRSNPWFLTLLNVGTHHPCAVPEELAEEFSSRKEAAVAYLDQALGDFFDRLKDIRILDDTLVVFVSDESHGVTGQPYGNNWGVAVAYTPESSGIINPGVFGLIDIPYSVLDYLDLTEQPHSFPKRSIFREYNTERAILFDSYFSERKGVVKKRINSNRVEVIQSSNGELFSREYITEIVHGDNGRILSERLRNYQTAVNNSLYDSERKDRKYILLENDEFIIGRTESRLLSSGQYLDIPGGTTVTVELEATVELDEEYDERGNSESIKLVLQLINEYKKMSIPEISIPILKDQDSLQLSFSFYTKNSLFRVWAYLRAISVNQSQPAKLKIELFSIETKESEAKQDDFRINRFFINEKGV